MGPLSYLWLQDTQNNDPELIQRANEPNSDFHKKVFDDHELICYTPPGMDKENNWKICLTDAVVDSAIEWFRQFLTTLASTD